MATRGDGVRLDPDYARILFDLMCPPDREVPSDRLFGFPFEITTAAKPGTVTFLIV